MELKKNEDFGLDIIEESDSQDETIAPDKEHDKEKNTVTTNGEGTFRSLIQKRIDHLSMRRSRL